MLNKTFLAVIIWLLLAGGVWAQDKAAIERIINTSKGTVGVAVRALDGNSKPLIINGNAKFPMQSVYKFPLAMAVLDQVDKGKLSLEQKILLTKQDLRPDTWSPLRDKYPQGNVSVTLAEVLAYNVSQSDNNACDMLFRLVGGPANVQKYIRSLGVKDMAIATTEEEMQSAWNVQFRNWSKPQAMLRLLEIMDEGRALSKSSNAFLWRIMTETTTGPNRIKGLLPADANVAHKTGTSGTNDKGITAAVNDAGVVTLPNGKKFAVVVLVANSTDDAATSEKVIAQISRAAWDYYLAKS